MTTANKSSVVNQIIDKFQRDFATLTSAPTLTLSAVATDKRDAFWHKYCIASAAFRRLIDKTCCYNISFTFDFWLNTPELAEFLREDLKSAEVILVELNRASALSLKQVEKALSRTEDAEEFRRLVLEERATKVNIWFSLEDRLKERRVMEIYEKI